MRILIAVAHADDETLGCFSVLTAAEHEVHLLHATDSTPLHPRYAAKAGYDSVDNYRVARREEMLAALKAIAFPAERWQQLPIADQDAPRSIAAIREAVNSYAADRIYTHAYEGGHPDHDAVAYALRDFDNVWEFPLYRASATGEFTTGGFLDGDRNALYVPTDPQSKLEALQCFRSQAAIVERFPREGEWFRPMKRYDFDRPPHEGPLYYEVRQHGWTWPEWRAAL